MGNAEYEERGKKGGKSGEGRRRKRTVSGKRDVTTVASADVFIELAHYR